MKTIIITLLLLTGIAYGQQKQDTLYTLKGVNQNFEFLKFALEHPRDVTPNQQEAIIKWIDARKPEIDTTKKK